ncbi:SDR family NAD(P)-dependent oxidoreductase [Bradyrhizobium ontarionense]|uniref:SDR family NAD(P)-dependent oxidoreductase n=1 Tax=Bradyrhizobium ontarionense TaxID=2898149 RepID=A0ABY3R8R4_9BRAD|nr:type I polyketide synthase [Bradyrhizobium sp. A19]UFZ03300.1 SDR family NAD(P)-dependent oxidoreductase [Bradyrhizobium sp. A19]
MSIAIIGLAGRFPGAPTVAQFWKNLAEGVESISEFSVDELRASGISEAELADVGYVKAGAPISDADLFDAGYFNISPKEAEFIDPQQRIFLECAVEALESAGCDPASFGGAIGVFAGVSRSTYQLYLSPGVWREVRASPVLQTLLIYGNNDDYLSTRLSYKLNLRGPSITVQTACSTSLVAVHFACQSLLSGESDIALAGGVSIQSSFRKRGYRYTEGGILSPDGHCRPFDASARGTLFGDGIGIVVLKRLDRALADGDPIRAVICGSAVNNDGAGKVGYTAPSVGGQAAVIAEAMAIAHVSPDTIDYVETHGTGTSLGDPIEIAALNEAYRSRTDKTASRPIWIGSVKSNIGHLNTAAGVASLIKTVLAMEKGIIPASLNFEQPNPKIDFAQTAFQVAACAETWARKTRPRRAGVSSFGIGGTNAHVVVEEAPAFDSTASDRPSHVLPLSARTASALDAATRNLAEYLAGADVNIADVAYTLAAGRTSHHYRRAVICTRGDDAVDAIQTDDPQRIIDQAQDLSKASICFMFPGQGSQRLNMSLGLYEHEPVFRRELDRSAELFEPHLGIDLRSLLFPSEEQAAEAASRLTDTLFAQAAIFAVSYSTAQLWASYGVKPVAMIGHSIGELVAACIAGVFSLDAAVQIVATRGRLMQDLPKGGMLAVALSSDDIKGYLNDNLSIAAINGPSLCAVSGPLDAISDLETVIRSNDIFCQRLRTSHAFHSAMMQAMVEPFVEVMGSVPLKAPSIPFISNVTGGWITEQEATDPRYWGRHLREAVNFAAGIEEMTRTYPGVLIEVGPGGALAQLAHENAAGRPLTTIVSMPHVKATAHQVEAFARGLAKLWVGGLRLDLSQLYREERRRKLPLPTYPFERQRYWAGSSQEDQPNPPHADLGGEGTFVPLWKRVAKAPDRSSPAEAQSYHWLVFITDDALCNEFMASLKGRHPHVTTVSAGSGFKQVSPSAFEIAPDQPRQYEELVSSLARESKAPDIVVYFWSATQEPLRSATVERAVERGFFGLMNLLRALGNGDPGLPLKLAAITIDTQSVTGDEQLSPIGNITRGPCQVGSVEYANMSCRMIDISRKDLAATRRGELIERLIYSIPAQIPSTVCAYRGGHLWMPMLERISLDPCASDDPSLRTNGVYLITGGTGGLGLAIAKSMAERKPVKLVLVSRSSFPARDEWSGYLASERGSKREARVIGQILEIEKLGSEVMLGSADVADMSAMRALVRLAEARYGRIHGVIHAAGLGRDEPIMTKSYQSAIPVLVPKIAGTLVLERIFADRGLDFLVLFSSVSALAGFVGHVDYGAANAFLDAFAQRGSPRVDKTISINWDAWSETGMAAHASAALPDKLRTTREEYLKRSISTAEGVDLFHRILAAGIPQVAVLKHPLRDPAAAAAARAPAAPVSAASTERQLKTEVRAQAQQAPKAVSALRSTRRYPRPNLLTPFEEPRTELETIVAELWAELLNLERIGVNDDFFELGGHSLLALQLIPRLRNRFQTDISPADVFGYPTVASMSSLIEEKLVAEIEQMEDEGV